MKLIDMIDSPNFNPATQQGRGEWSLRDVSSGDVFPHRDWHVACYEHGAMNAVNSDRTIWRCLMCGRSAFDLDQHHS